MVGLLLPQVLSRPLRDGAVDEVRISPACRPDLDLRVDRATAELADRLSSRSLKAATLPHLATAVSMGADRFITSNKRDFRPITEIEATYPADLAGPRRGDISTVKGAMDTR